MGKLTADKLLDEAIKWVGYCEKKDCSNLGDSTPEGKIVNAGQNNYTIFAKHLDDVTGEFDIYPQGGAWCDMYCDDTLLRVCIELFGPTLGVEKCRAILGGWSAYTPTSAGYYKKMGKWSDKPKKGAQIFFQNSVRIHHTGWVKGNDGTRVYTVEGNTNSGSYVIANGGQVREKSYLLTDPAIAGYGLPNFDAEELTGWVKVGNIYYYRLAPGVNAHGWLNILGADGYTYRYYFDQVGKMLTGWQWIDNEWYFFHDTVGSGREGALYVSDERGAQKIGTF